jgi:hypothetical protein
LVAAGNELRFFSACFVDSAYLRLLLPLSCQDRDAFAPGVAAETSRCVSASSSVDI